MLKCAFCLSCRYSDNRKQQAIQTLLLCVLAEYCGPKPKGLLFTDCIHLPGSCLWRDLQKGPGASMLFKAQWRYHQKNGSVCNWLKSTGLTGKFPLSANSWAKPVLYIELKLRLKE